MKLRNCWNAAAPGLVCLSLLMPAGSLRGAEPAARTADVQNARKPAIVDVSLTEQGELKGVIVDGDGQPQAGQTVTIRQGLKVLAETKTDARGEFQVSRLRPGTFNVITGRKSAAVRVWNHNTAPPVARDQALLVTSEGRLRAQDGIIPMIDLNTGLMMGLGVAGVTLGAVNLSEINDVQDTVDAILATIN